MLYRCFSRPSTPPAIPDFFSAPLNVSAILPMNSFWFPRAAAALDRGHHPERAHVVHAVRELDHDHADVAHHRQQHLAEALGLSFLAVLELNLIELADAVDQLRHDLSEDGCYLGLGGRRVF